MPLEITTHMVKADDGKIIQTRCGEPIRRKRVLEWTVWEEDVSCMGCIKVLREVPRKGKLSKQAKPAPVTAEIEWG